MASTSKLPNTLATTKASGGKAKANGMPHMNSVAKPAPSMKTVGKTMRNGVSAPKC